MLSYNKKEGSMGLAIKIVCSVIIVILGTVLFVVVRDAFGVGQYLIGGITAFCLIYMWSKNTG